MVTLVQDERLSFDEFITEVTAAVLGQTRDDTTHSIRAIPGAGRYETNEENEKWEQDVIE